MVGAKMVKLYETVQKQVVEELRREGLVKEWDGDEVVVPQTSMKRMICQSVTENKEDTC